MLVEFKKTAALSLPITLGMIGQGLYGIIDALMIGQFIGELAIAAATLGITVTILPIYCAIGLCIAVPVLTSQARGSGNLQELPHILRHGLFIAVAFCLVSAIALTVFIACGGLHALGQPDEVIAEARSFSMILAWSIVPAGAFHVMKVFLDAMIRPWTSLLWMTVGLVLNIFLNWVLMTGSLGFPNLGLDGVAWGTLFSRMISLAGAVVACRGAAHIFPVRKHGSLSSSQSDEEQKHHSAGAEGGSMCAGEDDRSLCAVWHLARFVREKFKQWSRGLEWRRVRQQLAIGIPCALQILFEGGIFIAAPIAMGWIGARALAANQVAMNASSIAYTIPLGLSHAASIRIGEAFGENNWRRLRKITYGVLAFSAAFMGAFAVAMLLFRHQIPVFYNFEPETALLAADLLAIVGAYSIFDGMQCASSGILRGLSDVRPIMWGSLVCYWIIAAPAALILAFPLGFGGCGIWAGMAVGLASAAAVFLTRLFRDLRRERIG